KEIERKKHLQSLYNRTKEQIEEEDVLFLELRRRRIKESEWLKERDNLLQLLNINNIITTTTINKKKRTAHQMEQYENTPATANVPSPRTNSSSTPNSANITSNNLVSSPKSMPATVTNTNGTPTGTPKPSSHHAGSARSVSNSPANSHSTSLHKTNAVGNSTTSSISTVHERGTPKQHHHNKASTTNDD
ncbi:hypothetical protein PIROE2DRAFT_8219, partial [Piromyces sp. E2]